MLNGIVISLLSWHHGSCTQVTNVELLIINTLEILEGERGMFSFKVFLRCFEVDHSFIIHGIFYSLYSFARSKYHHFLKITHPTHYYYYYIYTIYISFCIYKYLSVLTSLSLYICINARI